MQFEWEPDLDRAKLSKHGIDLGLAALVFADLHLALGEDRIVETGERRWHVLGVTAGLVVYREASDGEEIVRMMPDGKACEGERRAYFQ